MGTSDRPAIVHFMSDDPPRHFERVEEAVGFLSGPDPRCRQGAAWLEIGRHRSSQRAMSLRRPLLAQTFDSTLSSMASAS
ncbi:hypothetical protein GGR25_003530 [Kaistia hirudinis]|uniref:Uncharacterized protein n=1 Tax=Kaistia hirudinis TaxID=1293440 RepID=A0A840AS42_9HYPH|nr:hypothetical protein [Kaistia hirudinis]MBB3932472.1 hypothetical protein [Kaistia hirudinis]